MRKRNDSDPGSGTHPRTVAACAHQRRSATGSRSQLTSGSVRVPTAGEPVQTGKKPEKNR
jgi:hypothetical protein